MTDLGSFPEYVPDALPADRLADWRAAIVDGIASPPHEGRSRSSKSFSFLLTSGGPLLELAEALLQGFVSGPMHQRAMQLFGPDYLFLLDNCSIRRHVSQDASSTIAMHFDGMFLGSEPAVNFWVPLDTVGDTLPGLNFCSNKAVEAAMWKMLCSAQERVGWASVDPDALERLIPQGVKDQLANLLTTPQVEAGHCLLFSSGTLHATQTCPGWQGDRVYIEFRIAAPDAVPSVYASRLHYVARPVVQAGRLDISYEKRDAVPL